MGKRGEWMGFTLPYGGATTTYLDLAEAAGVFNIRCGFPEIPDMCATPSGPTAGAFDTTDLETEVANVHARGFGYCFSFLGVPKEVNASGPGHYYPTTSGGRTQVALYAAVCAAKLMDSHRSTGLPVWIEIFQEANIHNFNLADQSAAVVAAAIKACIDAVRVTEPDCPIIAGSLANRGDINNGSDADVIARWDGPDFVQDMLTAEPTLKTTSAPDYWGYHPYCGSSDPSSLSTGWGMQQMVQFGAMLAFSGAKAPDGSNPKVCITEFGSIRTRDLTGTISGTANGSTNLEITGANFLAGDSHALGEVDASLSGTNIQSGTRIQSRTSSTQVVMSRPATGTITGTVHLSRDAWQAEHVIRQLTAHDVFRKDGWVAGPEFTYQELGDEKSLFQSAGSHDPFNAGVAYEFFALLEPPSTPIDPPPPPPPPPAGGSTPIVHKIEIGVPPNPTAAPAAYEIGTDAIDDASHRLADSWAYQEVTGDVVSYDIVRGSRDGFDRVEVGTATVVIRNDRTDNGTAGDYSVFSWGSPFFPYLGPRARLRISADGKPLFCGDLTALPITDVHDNVVYVTLQAADFLAFLNKPIKYKPEAEHNAGKRIDRILERAGVRERGENQFLFPGDNTYQAGTLQEGSALDMCADVAFSEGGMFYANDTAYVFISREHMEEAPPLALWSDDPSEALHYSSLTRNSTWDHLFNTVTIKGLNEDDEARSAHDEVSCNLYGDARVEYTLPIASTIGRQFRANQLLAEFKVPQIHMEQMTIPTARYAAADRISYIYQEVGHVIAVERNAPGDTPITQNCVLVGIEHHASDGGRKFETVFNLRAQVG